MKQMLYAAVAMVLVLAAAGIAAVGLYQPAAPLLTQDIAGIVVAKTGRTLVLQTQSPTQALQVYAVSAPLAEKVQEGDSVTLHLQLHAQQEKSVLDIAVIQTGAPVDAETARKAKELLENCP